MDPGPLPVARRTYFLPMVISPHRDKSLTWNNSNSGRLRYYLILPRSPPINAIVHILFSVDTLTTYELMLLAHWMDGHKRVLLDWIVRQKEGGRVCLGIWPFPVWTCCPALVTLSTRQLQRWTGLWVYLAKERQEWDIDWNGRCWMHCQIQIRLPETTSR